MSLVILVGRLQVLPLAYIANVGGRLSRQRWWWKYQNRYLLPQQL